MYTFGNFVALRESVLTGDVVGLLRHYWSGHFDVAPILADAMDDATGDMGQLIRMPAQNQRGGDAKKRYAAIFRRWWPTLAAGASADRIEVGRHSTVSSPWLLLWWKRPGRTQTVGGKPLPYHEWGMYFQAPVSPEFAGHLTPVQSQFSWRLDQPPSAVPGGPPVGPLAHEAEEFINDLGVPVRDNASGPGRLSTDVPELVWGRPSPFDPRPKIMYERVATEEDLTPPRMLLAAVAAASPTYSSQVHSHYEFY